MKTFYFVPVALAYFGLSAAAFAGDLGYNTPDSYARSPYGDIASTKAAPAAASGFTWTAIYAGGNGGFAMGQFSYPFSASAGGASLSAVGTQSATGWLGGAQIGALYELENRIVVGAEADYDYGNAEVRVSPTAGSQFKQLITARLRLGYALFDRTLVYATAGYANGETNTYGLSGVTNSVVSDASSSGWAAGAGAQYAVTTNVILRAEYLHAELGKQTLVTGTSNGVALNFGIRPTLDFIRAGFDLKLDAPAMAPSFPVVSARY